MKKGLFIAFDGIDGCGKSTQLKKFFGLLFGRDKHNHIIITREPYKDVNIRPILKEDNDPYSKAEKLAELFIKDREIHANELINPSISSGIHVISDRYKLSTIAYQAAQGIDIKELIAKHKDMPVPDFTFIIDVSVEESAKRMAVEGREKHKLEANMEFLNKARNKFKEAKELLKNERIYIINGERDANSISEDIKNIFEQNLSNIN